MNDCARLKQALIDHGLDQVLSSPEFETHHKTCIDCARLLEAFGDIPQLLAELPEHEPSSQLQEATLKGTTHTNQRNTASRQRLATALAASLVGAAVIGLFLQAGFQSGRNPDFMPTASKAPMPAAASPSRPGAASPALETEQEQLEFDDESQTGNEKKGRLSANVTQDRFEMVPETVGGGNSQAPAVAGEDNAAVVLDKVAVTGSRINRTDIESASPVIVIPRSDSSAPEPVTTNYEGLFGHRASRAIEKAKDAEPQADNKEHQGDFVTQTDAPRLESDKRDAAIPQDFTLPRNLESPGRDADAPNPAREQRQNNPADPQQANTTPVEESAMSLSELLAEAEVSREISGQARDGVRVREQHFRVSAEDTNSPDTDGDTRSGQFDNGWATIELTSQRRAGELAPATPPAKLTFSEGTHRYLLDPYLNDEEPVFQPAEGYWANTYVPGDPAIRLLRARLAGWNRQGLPRDGALETQVQPYAQPLDAPAASALGLSVLSDANAVSGPTRMRLQVGIRAIEQRRGQRPAMNVGIVVDLPADIDDQQRIAARALLDGLLAARQAGDHFALAFSGPGGGLALSSEQFRFGPLELAKQKLLAGDQGASVSLPQALAAAAQEVARHDNPKQPLGSSALLLITAGDLAAVTKLKNFAHDKARTGMTLSVFPLGTRPTPGRVEALVLAGLGNRRILDTPSGARNLVEEELRSASRAVARAARLSVRLAAGVQLINVVGASRLADPAAQRVRDIEQSMDQRLRSNLGIIADRGNDEQGIQIVIPSIFMGDTLTILIDVVAEQAGPIADVSLRFKDLVFLKNGVLHGQAQLPSGELKRGPQELAVLKNLLGKTVIEAIEQAAEALANNDVSAARDWLQRAARSITHYRQTEPAWQRDPDLLRDEQVLNDYLEILHGPNLGQLRAALADSMRFAAWRKTHQIDPSTDTE